MATAARTGPPTGGQACSQPQDPASRVEGSRVGQGELRAEGVGGSGRQVPRACGSSSSLPRALDLGSALARDSMSGSSEPEQNRGSQTEMPRETPMRPLGGGTIHLSVASRSSPDFKGDWSLT